MVGISEDAVRKRAYDIWEREGRPHGRDFEHWVRAQVELTAEVIPAADIRLAAPPRPSAKTAKAAAPKRSRAAARPPRAKKPV